LRWSARTLLLRRTQGRSLSRRWVTQVRLKLTARCLRVPTGRTMLLRLLTHIVRQCGACPGVVGVGVAVSANLRFNVMPCYHNNLRRGRRPRRPLFGLPQTLASDYCTLLCGCGRVPSSTSALCALGHATACRTRQRRARCGLASPHSGCHPPALTSGK
jgi:hypothetical protein